MGDVEKGALPDAAGTMSDQPAAEADATTGAWAAPRKSEIEATAGAL